MLLKCHAEDPDARGKWGVSPGWLCTAPCWLRCALCSGTGSLLDGALVYSEPTKSQTWEKNPHHTGRVGREDSPQRSGLGVIKSNQSSLSSRMFC